MKKGFWNYTEPVEFRVVFVRLLPEPGTPLHWQNAIAGDICQAIEVTYNGKKPFLIFNDDGSGWCKMERLGGPDSGSKHIGAHEFISEVPDAQIVKRFEPIISTHHEHVYNAWAEKNYPKEFERLKLLEEGLKKLYRDNPRAFPQKPK